MNRPPITVHTMMPAPINYSVVLYVVVCTLRTPQHAVYLHYKRPFQKCQVFLEKISAVCGEIINGHPQE